MMFLNLRCLDKEWLLKEINMASFCMRNTASAECFGKGTGSKPASAVPGCEGRHAKELRKLLAKDSPSVSTLEFKEGEVEKGYMNVLVGVESKPLDNEE
jgi:hypothetical protein